MKVKRLNSALLLGLGLLLLGSPALADKPDGKGKGGGGGGGQAEEVASQAEVFNDAGFAFRGDTVGTTSLYQDATLSGDCALVIATRIDKQSGTAFLWAPDPRMGDNCDMPFNRSFESDYPEIFAPPVYAKIAFAGLYRPIIELMADGVVNVSIAIGPYRITYPPTTTSDLAYDPAGGDTYDIRTVTLGSAPADICAWPPGKRKGKTICESVGDGTIDLPMKVKFWRNPPQQ